MKVGKLNLQLSRIGRSESLESLKAFQQVK